MKGSISLFAAITLVSSASAFAPAPSFSRVATPLFAEKKEMVLDTNFENVNVVRLLGLKRLKKKSRKSKSRANAANKEN
jgi:hypothetical protein